MNWIKVIRLVKEIYGFKVDVKTIIDFAGDTFGEGVARKVGDVLRKINTNKDGKVDILEVLLYIVRELKK